MTRNWGRRRDPKDLDNSEANHTFNSGNSLFNIGIYIALYINNVVGNITAAFVDHINNI